MYKNKHSNALCNIAVIVNSFGYLKKKENDFTNRLHSE